MEPVGFRNRLKWSLLQRWFAPEKTIDKKLYSSLVGGDDTDLGSWARFKRYLLRRWLPTIRLQQRPSDDGAVPLSEINGTSTSAPASLDRYDAGGTVNELAKLSTPVAMADAEPAAVQQLGSYGLRPMSLQERRSSVGSAGAPRHSEDRPSSRGSSGIMIEERNLSDSESDPGQGAEPPASDEQRGERRDERTA